MGSGVYPRVCKAMPRRPQGPGAKIDPFDLYAVRINAMPALLNNIDPDGLLEFSVVYTDRALNHMSDRKSTRLNSSHT